MTVSLCFIFACYGLLILNPHKAMIMGKDIMVRVEAGTLITEPMIVSTWLQLLGPHRFSTTFCVDQAPRGSYRSGDGSAHNPFRGGQCEHL